MSVKILWMYHDLMDLYGDKGNIQVLKTRCERRGIACSVDTCTISEKKCMKDYDLIFMGGGADREQNLIYNDLNKRKDNIIEAMDSGTAFLLICGGYQMFGEYYLDQDGNKVPGLGIFKYYTESTDRDHRCIGNIAVEAKIDGKVIQVVGFENHGGQTKNVISPFARVLKGNGNEHNGTFEGYMNNLVIATYMHGPLLPKNPEIADILIKRALRKRDQQIDLKPLDDEIENRAREVMLKRMHVVK